MFVLTNTASPSRRRIVDNVADVAAVIYVLTPDKGTDTDNIISAGHSRAGLEAQGRVVGPVEIVICERFRTDSRVGDVVGGFKERMITEGGAAGTACVRLHCAHTTGGVLETARIIMECVKTGGRIVVAVLIVKERFIPVGSVVVAKPVGKERVNAGGRVAVAGKAANGCVAKESVNAALL